MIIRSISGIRGTLPDFGTHTIDQAAYAFHQLQPEGAIVVGRDTRPSGEELVEELAATLNSLGRDVINLNVAPTPTIQFMVEHSDAAGGIILTASHNPIEWNGLKFVRDDGTFYYPEQCQKLFQLMDENKSSIAKEIGLHLPDVNAIQKHIIHILSLSCIDVNQIRKRKFKVVIDAVNGAASTALPELCEALGCEVVPLYCDSSGDFQRPPEPLPNHLTDLSKAVTDTNADIGFASDPDGDRLAVVMENGIPAGDEYTLVIATDGYLRTVQKNVTLVTNLSTTLAIEKIAEKYGCNVVRSAVGEINVVQKMLEEDSPLGGEGNGGVILKEAHLGRDSLVAVAMILHRMILTDQKISTIFQELPQFKMVKDKIYLDGNYSESIFPIIKKKFSSAHIDETDGLKFVWSDRWIHIRKSNTEPIIRIYADSPSEQESRQLVEQIKESLKS